MYNTNRKAQQLSDMRCRFTKFYNLYFVEDLHSTDKYELSRNGIMIPARRTYEQYCTQYNVAYGDDLGVHKVNTFCRLILGLDTEPLIITKR